jgi:predicted PurR-regulated permease PerM
MPRRIHGGRAGMQQCGVRDAEIGPLTARKSCVSDISVTDGARPGQRLALGVMALFFVLLGLWTLKTFLPALAWAAVFAVALWPLYLRAERALPVSRHRMLLPLGFTVAVALVFVVPLVLLGAELAREAHGISQWAQNAHENGIPVPPQVQALPLAGARLAGLWQQHLSHPHPAAGVLERLRQPGTMTEGREVGASLVRRLTLFGFTLLTLFVLLKEGDGVTAQLRRASRRAFGGTGERIGGQIVASIHGTVTGLVLVGLAEGAVLGVAYAVAGVPHPVLLGVISAVAAILPFGATAAAAVAALLLAATGGLVAALVLFAFGSAMAFATDHFVRPVLIGGATKLPFLWVLLGILGGLEVWGLLGLFLGPAIMAALMLLWRDWVGEEAASGA